ncbi:MAG TPA: GNAT family N-acetyltransferase [Anaerovoracaceae bacterium]|nr:GNAT family N-acetyltransferase [Anaerovoracaceae bacterium]
MKTPVIETERLLLRPLTVGDAKAIFEGWARDQEVARFMRWNPHKTIAMANAVMAAVNS